MNLQQKKYENFEEKRDFTKAVKLQQNYSFILNSSQKSVNQNSTKIRLVKEKTQRGEKMNFCRFTSAGFKATFLFDELL